MKLPDGFEFGIVTTDDELEELIKFNSIVHTDDDPDELRRQIDLFPDFTRESCFYIRDVDKGKIVSSSNAIPSIWSYSGVELRNLELGWVGTLKEYRQRGFSRALYNHFEKLLFEGKYDISTIQGIPYFYRQFGYDFVLPMNRMVWMNVSQTPNADPETTPYMSLGVREAENKDLKDMIRLHEEYNRRILVSVKRSEEFWQIQEDQKRMFEDEFSSFVIDNNGKIIGYFRLVKWQGAKDVPTSATLGIMENHIQTYHGVMRAIQFFREKSIEIEANMFGVMGPEFNNLARVTKDLGGVVHAGWKHQVRIPDMISLLKKISPVLEKRLEGTMFQGLTQELCFNAFRNCYVFKFESGKIVNIEDIGIQEVHEKRTIRVPPQDFVRLIFGEYSLDELKSHNVDFLVGGSVRALVETLFPKQDSCIYYYYC